MIHPATVCHLVFGGLDYFITFAIDISVLGQHQKTNRHLSSKWVSVFYLNPTEGRYFPLGFFIDHDIRIAGIRNDTPQSPKASADLHEGNPEKEGQLAELRGEMADSDGTMMRRPGLAPLVKETPHPARRP